MIANYKALSNTGYEEILPDKFIDIEEYYKTNKTSTEKCPSFINHIIGWYI